MCLSSCLIGLGAEQVCFGPAATPQVVLWISIAVEELVEPCAKFLLNISLPARRTAGLLRLAVQIEPLAGIGLEVIQFMRTIRMPLDVLPFNSSDSPNILEFVKDNVVPLEASSLQYR